MNTGYWIHLFHPAGGRGSLAPDHLCPDEVETNPTAQYATEAAANERLQASKILHILGDGWQAEVLPAPWYEEGPLSLGPEDYGPNEALWFDEPFFEDPLRPRSSPGEHQ